MVLDVGMLMFWLFTEQIHGTELTHSLTYPSERPVETVNASVTVLERMMAEAAHTDSVEERITAEIKKTVDFGWIRCDCCLLHHQDIAHGIVGSVTRITTPWCKRKNWSRMEASRYRATQRKNKNHSHT
jgi:hypothetical protein